MATKQKWEDIMSDEEESDVEVPRKQEPEQVPETETKTLEARKISNAAPNKTQKMQKNDRRSKPEKNQNRGDRERKNREGGNERSKPYNNNKSRESLIDQISTMNNETIHLNIYEVQKNVEHEDIIEFFKEAGDFDIKLREGASPSYDAEVPKPQAKLMAQILSKHSGPRMFELRIGKKSIDRGKDKKYGRKGDNQKKGKNENWERPSDKENFSFEDMKMSLRQSSHQKNEKPTKINPFGSAIAINDKLYTDDVKKRSLEVIKDEEPKKEEADDKNSSNESEEQAKNSMDSENSDEDFDISKLIKGKNNKNVNIFSVLKKK